MVVRLLFGLFLFGTGIMTMGIAVNGYRSASRQMTSADS